MDMKIYAEFKTLPNGQEFRKKTLIQIGGSTKLIGSAILINPGSAEPIRDINQDADTVKKFYLDNHNIDISDVDLARWKLFKADHTMLRLIKIFNGSYISRETKLEGIIQLFNCSYYKEQSLNKARDKLLTRQDCIFDEHELLSNAPVYFGWGDEGKYGVVNNIAEEIFKNYDLSLTPIYSEEFLENTFYHPTYINRSYNSNAKTQNLLNNFYEALHKV